MAYDQLLKDLLRQFFAAFLEQFFPDQAARLDLTQVDFLEQEMATDFPQGRHRELDLVARVVTRSGEPEFVLAHVELEARRKRDFPSRMFDYYTILRRRHQLPVLPIVVYITGGRGLKRWEIYREGVFGEVIVTFRYRRLRLQALKATEAVASGDPLVCAMSVLMDRLGADLAVLKAASLESIGRSRFDEARQALLVNVVETYLPLAPAEENRFQELLTQQEHQMAKRVQLTWFDQIRLRAKQEDLLTVLRTRFSPVPEELMRRIEAIESSTDLDTILARASTATSLDEVRAALPHG